MRHWDFDELSDEQKEIILENVDFYDFCGENKYKFDMNAIELPIMREQAGKLISLGWKPVDCRVDRESEHIFQKVVNDFIVRIDVGLIKASYRFDYFGISDIRLIWNLLDYPELVFFTEDYDETRECRHISTSVCTEPIVASYTTLRAVQKELVDNGVLFGIGYTVTCLDEQLRATAFDLRSMLGLVRYNKDLED